MQFTVRRGRYSIQTINPRDQNQYHVIKTQVKFIKWRINLEYRLTRITCSVQDLQKGRRSYLRKTVHLFFIFQPYLGGFFLAFFGSPTPLWLRTWCCCKWLVRRITKQATTFDKIARKYFTTFANHRAPGGQMTTKWTSKQKPNR